MAGTAFIGLGMMGQGMARNILGSGVVLRGYDVSHRAREVFQTFGGVSCDSARAAAAGCDLVLIMVQTPAQARQVLFDDGVAAALELASTVVLCSTVAPSDVRSLAKDLSAFGHDLMDAPVSGGQVGADAGTLTIMASGPDKAFERAMPVLEAMARKVHRLGSVAGLGATYKVVHQLAAGVHLVAAAELMALGTKAGCDPQTLYDIVTTSAGNSWMFADRAPRMMQADPPATSSVDIFIKDVGLVLQTGREAGVPLPLAAAAQQMLVAASNLGHGAHDDSCVVRAYEALTGQKIHEN